MVKSANKIFVLIVVLIVILTSFLTWKVSEWQNEKADSQNVNAAAYGNLNGNGGKVSINLIPPETNEVK